MPHHIVIQPLAEDDITQAALWYQLQREGLGEAFLADIELAMESAATAPRQFPCLRRRPEVRRVLAGRFPYRIFYVVHSDRIVVFRVLHGAQHDLHWESRVPQN